MAEVAPTIQSTNYFALPATFGLTNAVETEFKSFTARFGGNSNFLCSQEYDKGINYENEADFCGGATPDIVSALGAMLSTFGAVASAKQPTKIEIGFEAGIGANLKIEGHQHDDNPHTALNTFDCSGVIPALSGVGVPDLIVVAGVVSPVNATVSNEIEHVDKAGADGKHFEGQNVKCHVTLSVDYAGWITGSTAGDWLNIVVVKSGPNDDTPTSSLTAEQWIDVIQT
jgi:hypothetical protein